MNSYLFSFILSFEKNIGFHFIYLRRLQDDWAMIACFTLKGTFYMYFYKYAQQFGVDTVYLEIPV